MWQKIIISTWLLFLISSRSEGQVLTYQFIDPCTKQITFFSVPANGTTIFFLGQSRQFTASDVLTGVFGSWVNQTYADYRKVMPCSQQSGQVIQNQIISQSISGTVQGLVSNIVSQAQANNPSSSVSSITNSQVSSKISNVLEKNKIKNNNSKENTDVSSDIKTNLGSSSGSNNTTNSNVNTGTGISNANNSANTQDSKTSSEEISATITMNKDATQEKSGNKSSKTKVTRGNPILVNSDVTSAQNLDRTFTPIINIGISRSSMTGASSFNLTSMTWLNFKQFAISGRYTKMHYNKIGSLKYIHNISITGVYTYGNILSFIGYSGILNGGRFGVTGFNISAAATVVNGESRAYISPSFTAFYTKPIKINNKASVSPEVYIISTPLIYSSYDKITITDRTFSGFLGTGFDYQITKRFKLNANYKANISSNSEFPILSFLLIGSKINL